MPRAVTGGPTRPKSLASRMNLYLDDDMAKRSLVARLRRAGHRIVLPNDAGLSGGWDPLHMLHAVLQRLVLVSKNHDDFPNQQRIPDTQSLALITASRAAIKWLKISRICFSSVNGESTYDLSAAMGVPCSLWR